MRRPTGRIGCRSGSRRLFVRYDKVGIGSTLVLRQTGGSECSFDPLQNGIGTVTTVGGSRPIVRTGKVLARVPGRRHTGMRLVRMFVHSVVVVIVLAVVIVVVVVIVTVHGNGQ